MTEAAKKNALASEASSVKTPYFILGCILVFIALVFVFVKLPVIQNMEGHVAGKNIFHAFKHRHLSRAVGAQFAYVGAQVCVFSLFILVVSKAADISEVAAAAYLGVCGIAFLVGRFLGTFLMKKYLPQRLLAAYACINIFLCVVALVFHGIITAYAIIGISFFYVHNVSNNFCISD